MERRATLAGLSRHSTSGEPHGEDLVRRYRLNYGILPEAVVTEDMILRHWDLEQQLTRELLASTPANRWEVFERCYTTLYAELRWLNELVEAKSGPIPATKVAEWCALIGSPRKRVYEIGSGRGQLIRALAECGYECTATEITRERGEKWTTEHPNLKWKVSDGVHLDQFEAAGSYDVVISSHVVEHLHPDDLSSHFQGVATVLAKDGKYILSTPHSLIGPSDVSRVFKCSRPEGMHLKEYTYGELVSSLRQAGFSHFSAPFRPWARFMSLAGRSALPAPSSAYLAYLRLVEDVVALVPGHRIRRKIGRLARLIGFASNIVVVATVG